MYSILYSFLFASRPHRLKIRLLITWSWVDVVIVSLDVCQIRLQEVPILRLLLLFVRLRRVEGSGRLLLHCYVEMEQRARPLQ